MLVGTFLHDAEGHVAFAFGLAAPFLIGAMGLAIDATSINHQYTRMQEAADSASLAIAKELHVYHDNLAELKAVGRARAETMLAEVDLAARPHQTDVEIDDDENLVKVSIAMTAESFLPAEIWGDNPIRVSSFARAYGQSKLCVLGLDKSKSDAIKAEGSATLTAPQCAVQSNSTDPAGLNVASGATIVSTVICSSGGVKADGTLEPAPETDCPQLDDPLASRAPPAPSGCDYLDRRIESGAVTISPGHYCGGLKIEKTAAVTASPGVYVVSGGKLEVKDTATLVGEYVTFYFQDDAALLDFDKDTTIDLGAPKEGPTAGILFFENPAAAAGRDFKIRSENAGRLLGTIYLPKGNLEIDAKANVADASAYTVIVAKEIGIKDANLVVNADYGGTDVPVPEGLGPNSSMVKLDR
jgi:hypothetical protein